MEYASAKRRRGFAHIGALRALREDNLPIDIVGGTSMGSFVGAEHAFGLTPERMIDLNRNLFTNTGLALDLTLPLLSFTTGKGYAARLRKLFGDVAIEDLWIPYFCVSSNISRAERAIHRNRTFSTRLCWVRDIFARLSPSLPVRAYRQCDSSRVR